MQKLAHNAEVRLILLQFNQLAGLCKNNQPGTGNHLGYLFGERKRGAKVVIAAHNQRRLLDLREARKRIMDHDHVDPLQSNLTVARLLGMRRTTINPRLHLLGMFTRVAW